MEKQDVVNVNKTQQGNATDQLIALSHHVIGYSERIRLTQKNDGEIHFLSLNSFNCVHRTI